MGSTGESSEEKGWMGRENMNLSVSLADLGSFGSWAALARGQPQAKGSRDGSVMGTSWFLSSIPSLLLSCKAIAMHMTQAVGVVFWSLSAEPVMVLTASTQKYYKVKVVRYHHFSTLILSELVSTASWWETAVPKGGWAGTWGLPQHRPCPHRWVPSHCGQRQRL